MNSGRQEKWLRRLASFKDPQHFFLKVRKEGPGDFPDD